MADNQVNDMSNMYIRLASFGANAMDVVTVSSPSTFGCWNLRYNSPLKLAKAGFYCVPGTNGNILSCFACSAEWKNPRGESPMAVHRTISPNCPFLKASPISTPAPLIIPGDVNTARRNLFSQRNDFGSISLENNCYLYTDQPKVNENEMFAPIGGADYLFESRRILTFDNLTKCTENLLKASQWAANGFIFKPTDMVQCVFCNLCLPFSAESPTSQHQKAKPQCPFVLKVDVGNITLKLENEINAMKQSEQLQVSSLEKPFAVHPQFESHDQRLNTFREWSPQLYQTAEQLNEAGFYYTGCADKVVCFCCGVGLKKWRCQADPWVQHARLSPQCIFLNQIKGSDFVQEAQQAEIEVDFDPPKVFQEGPVSSNGTLTTTSPVSAGLDLNVIKAALECQYNMPQIRQAILKIHNLTCGFPNFPLLIGELQAEDHNLKMLQMQKQQLENERLRGQQLEEEKEREKLRGQQLEKEKERERQEKERERQEKERERLRGQQLEKEKERERQEKERERQEKERERLEKERERLRGQQLEEEKERERQEKLRLEEQMYADIIRLALERQNWQTKFRQEEERRRHEEEMRRQEEERRRQEEEMRRHDEERRKKEEERYISELSQQEKELQRLKAEIFSLRQRQATQQETASSSPDTPAPVSPVTNMAPQCITCVQEPATALFLPCSHLCCGVVCSQHFINKPCPVCRQTVAERKIVFIA